ncbi:putative RNA-directed DNA polymerase [Tanacetum coccineum]
MGHIDGSLSSPSPTVKLDDKESPNPPFSSWREANQRTFLILQASLTEEAIVEVIGLATAREVWLALELAYSHDSVERMQNLIDSMCQIQKCASFVAEYG